MRSAQEIAREALAAPGGKTWSEEAAAFAVALHEIAALPASAPFALPVDDTASVRVSLVDSVTRAGSPGCSAALWRYTHDSDMEEIERVHPPYAAAWLAAFNVPEKEAGK